MPSYPDQRRIKLLKAGGTIAQCKDASLSNTSCPEGEEALDRIILEVKELFKSECILDAESVYSGDSTEMDKTQWMQLVKLIEGAYPDYDGFLITMGTNTLAYAASALSFALRGIQKPVVITGAQLPAETRATDARNNLINSIRVLLKEDFARLLHGVYVVFGSKIIRGCRAKKVSEFALDAFSSFNTEDVGRIGIDISINPNLCHTDEATREFAVQNDFDDAIICVTLLPGLNSGHLKALIDSGIKGMILRAFGSGDIPEVLFDTLDYARAQRTHVIVTTQCPDGATRIGLNASGKNALEYGIIPSYDMSMEAMTTKLMWLLAKPIPYEDMKKEMRSNYVGECEEY